MGETTKKKRGRPTVMERSEGTVIVDIIAQNDYRNQTHRTHTNQAYVYAGSYFIGEHYTEIPHADTLVYQSDNIYLPKKTRQAVLEQIGRAIEQDHYRDEDILALSIYATSMINRGYTVKQAANWLRKVRKEGFKDDPKILEAATNISITYGELAILAYFLDILEGVLEFAEQETLANRKSLITEMRIDPHNLDYEKALKRLRDIRKKLNSRQKG